MRRHFKTKVEAEKFIKLVNNKNVPRDALYADIKSRAGDIRLEMASRLFIEASKIGRDGEFPLERYTISGYEPQLRLHILPILARKYLGAITPLTIREFRDDMMKSGASRITTRNAIRLLSNIFSYMHLIGRMVSNPAAKVKVITASHRARAGAVSLDEIPTFEQMQRLFSELLTLKNAPDELGARWSRGVPLILLASLCGLRNSEIRGLPREAFDRVKLTIHVYQRCDRGGTVGLPKSAAGHRLVPVPKRVASMLDDLLASHDHGLVFCTKNGRPLSHSNINRDYWFPSLREAGIEERWGIHRLRHFYASLLFDEGLPLPTISRLLGHSNASFTLRTYIHLFERARSGDNLNRARRIIDDTLLTVGSAEN